MGERAFAVEHSGALHLSSGYTGTTDAQSNHFKLSANDLTQVQCILRKFGGVELARALASFRGLSCVVFSSCAEGWLLKKTMKIPSRTEPYL